MAKRKPAAAVAQGGALGDLAEELGAFLGRTERAAAEWLDQRKSVGTQLTELRAHATKLLAQLGSVMPELPLARGKRRRHAAKKTKAKATKPNAVTRRAGPRARARGRETKTSE